MNESAPERGAGSDDPHRGVGSVAGIARWVTLGKVIVRTGSSNVDAIEFCHRTCVACPFSISASSSRSQSERGLDLADPSPEGERSARASGKSDGTRSDRSETSSGGCGELSAGWREVAEQLHAEEGTGHE